MSLHTVNTMKMFGSAFLIGSMIFLASCVSDIGTSPKQKSPLHGTSSLVFVDLEGAQSADETLEFAPLPFSISDQDIIQSLVEAAQTSKHVLEYPGVGHLAKLVCLDKNGRPIMMADLVNYRCVVTLDSCEKKAGKYVVDMSRLPPGPPKAFYAEDFVRQVYGYMKDNMKEQMTALREEYSRQGKDLEKLLFHGQ